MDTGGFGGILNVTAGVNGGSMTELSKWRRGEDETRWGVGCVKNERPLIGLISWDDERIRAISSSARPRFIRFPSTFTSPREKLLAS